MRIRVISSTDEFESLKQTENIIHLAFRPSNTDIFSIVTKCPQLKAIQIPPSYKKTISKTTITFLEMQGIKLLEGDVWGHRKDLNEYSEVSPNIYDRINELRQKGMSDSDIAEKMSRETRLNSDFVSFLLTYNN
ncbi:hypothetical protein Metho_2534 (plasmid) [Methanomethylovorans hollandica DSM 15978]|uniref:DUF1699 family protein n=1 Tax=Methanomethylovorans hollandica (strain DSM 15978 / NBRC 107637 / DMS1) TaxID=867904 RepID=L0L2M8_METHD|nr:DUF1699 family protein [Methanomethylovorans hollandica]AGB50673.1 hypothetical protein Metho_2534 [Methanomethylovorans hollandica DSM 15978]